MVAGAGTFTPHNPGGRSPSGRHQVFSFFFLMKPPLTFSSRAARCFGALAGLLLAAGLPLASALAQAPNPTAIFPVRNVTRALPAVSPVFGFDTNMGSGAGTPGSTCCAAGP